MRITDKKRLESFLGDKIDQAATEAKAATYPTPTIKDLPAQVRKDIARVKILIERIKMAGVTVDWEYRYDRGPRHAVATFRIPTEHPAWGPRRTAIAQIEAEARALKDQLVLDLYADDADGKTIVTGLERALAKAFK